jgi:proteic killer suppression protein
MIETVHGLGGSMDVEHADECLCRLESDARFMGGFSAEIVRAYRKRLWFIRQAMDERDIYAMKSFHFEKLQGARAHQRSIRLNKQWRLILEIVEAGTEKTVRIIAIEDYH